MADRIKRVASSPITLESSGADNTLENGDIYECTDDDLQTADVDGNFTATFEFDAVGTFSAAPTVGNALHVYEQKINSEDTDAPDIVDAVYDLDYLFSFEFALSDVAQYLRREGVPINLTGGKYWLEWEDGGSGTAEIEATWEFRVLVEKTETVAA